MYFVFLLLSLLFILFTRRFPPPTNFDNFLIFIKKKKEKTSSQSDIPRYSIFFNFTFFYSRLKFIFIISMTCYRFNCCNNGGKKKKKNSKQQFLRGPSNCGLLLWLFEWNNRGENAVTCCYRCITNRVDDESLEEHGPGDDDGYLWPAIPRCRLHDRGSCHIFARE